MSRRTDKVLETIYLKDAYKELNLSHSVFIAEKKAKEQKICGREGCCIPVRKSKHKYCSAECYSIGRIKYGVIPCKQCAIPFQSGRFNKYFCSKKCHHDYIKVELFCANPECKKPMNDKRSQTHCSKECFNKMKIKRIPDFTNCQWNECGSFLTKKQIESKQKYCCRKCYNLDKKEKKGDGIGKISFRKVKGFEYPLRFIKTEKGWIRFSKYIWEKTNGPIPENHRIAFKDKNTFNDENVNNLYIVDNGGKN